MLLPDLLNTNLTKEQHSLKVAFELITSLISTEQKLDVDNLFSGAIEQLQQTECFLNHQLQFEKNKTFLLANQNAELRRKADLAESYKQDCIFKDSQNLILLNTIANAHEERRLIEAKNEHLRVEFSTKINLLNQAVKDHRENFNSLEREKKKQNAELKSLQDNLFACKLALAKYQPSEINT